MSQEAYEALKRELMTGRESIAELYQRQRQRQREVEARHVQWKADREQAQANDQQVPPLTEDSKYQELISQREAISETLRHCLARPRLDAAAMAALRAQLTPDEKSRLHQHLLAGLKSSPREIKEKAAATMTEVAERFRAEHGSTPEIEAALAKMERLKEQMNGTD